MLSIAHYAPFLGIFGLIIAVLVYRWIGKQPTGTELMKKIEGYIYTGAMAFLRRQYSILAIFVLVVFILITIGINVWTALCFVTGALCSMFAGYFGMRTSARPGPQISPAWAGP